MKRILAGVAAFAVTVATLSTLCACSQKSSFTESFFALDTAARLAVANVKEADFKALSEKVETFLTSAENSLSCARPNSYICKFNQAAAGATVKLDGITYEVLKLAQEVYIETDGYFNPAVYYCEDLYGFAARPANIASMPYDREDATKALPEEKYITAFKELSERFSEVEIYELDGAYYATKPHFTAKVEGDEREYSLSLDLGGIAKGWCVDKVNQILADAGVEYGYFNLGMSSMSVKSRADGDGNYSVYSGDPRGSGSYASFKMRNANLSTSGDDRKYYEIDGTRYSHVISPLTGSPVRTGVASVTVVGGSAGRSDALTTALSAMGAERAAEFIDERLSDCKVIMLVFADGAGKVITNAPDYFEILNKKYVLANTVENGKIVLA